MSEKKVDINKIKDVIDKVIKERKASEELQAVCDKDSWTWWLAEGNKTACDYIYTHLINSITCSNEGDKIVYDTETRQITIIKKL
jgi:hypothetical protein